MNVGIVSIVLMEHGEVGCVQNGRIILVVLKMKVVLHLFIVVGYMIERTLKGVR